MNHSSFSFAVGQYLNHYPRLRLLTTGNHRHKVSFGANLLLGLQAPVNHNMIQNINLLKRVVPNSFRTCPLPEFFDFGETP